MSKLRFSKQQTFIMISGCHDSLIKHLFEEQLSFQDSLSLSLSLSLYLSLALSLSRSLSLTHTLLMFYCTLYTCV